MRFVRPSISCHAAGILRSFQTSSHKPTFRMSHHRIVLPGGLLLPVLLLAIFACKEASGIRRPGLPTKVSPPPPVDSTPSPTSTPALTPTAVFAYRPSFQDTPCVFTVPSDSRPRCGYLLVPEKRTDSHTAWIRLHVAIFPNRSGLPVKDPVVHLAGGPGSSSLGEAGYLFDRGLDAVLDQRDLVLYDQRGTGYSQPRLDCPEREQLAPILLEGNLPVEGNEQAILEAFHKCRERLLAAGIDLSAYTSASSADDLEDLRLALGYEKLNLYAVSYGTRLALTFMRDYPGSVRSAVLDSAYPLQVNLYTSLAPNAERAFNVFFNRCAVDAGCAASFPDLKAVFYRLVDDLNSNPIFVSLSAGSAQYTVRVDGGRLIDALFTGLYNPVVTASMPRMIFDIRRGNYHILERRLALYFENTSALGMQMSVQCNEELPFDTMGTAYAAAQGLQPQIAAYYLPTVQALFDACSDWTGSRPAAIENMPVRSELPALILAGEGDPITPPEWGRLVAEDLSHAYFREFAGNGHWATRSSSCALQMALAFWENPSIDPAGICA